MKEYSPVKEGKVREIYDIGDNLIMVATDRISAFDVILKNEVNGKGVVLTKMSEFWFGLTSDIVKNHMISTDTKDMPEFFRTPEFLLGASGLLPLNFLRSPATLSQGSLLSGVIAVPSIQPCL